MAAKSLTPKTNIRFREVPGKWLFYESRGLKYSYVPNGSFDLFRTKGPSYFQRMCPYHLWHFQSNHLLPSDFLKVCHRIKSTKVRPFRSEKSAMDRNFWVSLGPFLTKSPWCICKRLPYRPWDFQSNLLLPGDFLEGWHRVNSTELRSFGSDNSGMDRNL